MSKVAHYLQEHISGEVMTSPDACKYFATDASILSIKPAIVVYPRTENDIRKTLRFACQLAERGRQIPITARGSGTDVTGAALGNGVMMVFPAHLNRVLEMDAKSGVVIVEPGINYGKLQQTLQTHQRFLPPFPASLEYATVGGAVANNASGVKSVKYGDTLDYVRNLRVVLSNGEVIETHRLSKRELNKKMGLQTFEGEIYRGLDKLLEESKEALEQLRANNAVRRASGYNAELVRRKDGSFDLTPLLVGSQGTLGIISEIVLETELYNPQTTVVAAYIDDIQTVQDILREIRTFSESPSMVEFVSKDLISLVVSQNPHLFRERPVEGKHVLLIEFDQSADRQQKKYVKKLQKVFKHHNVNHEIETELHKKDQLLKLRQAPASYLAHSEGGARPLPFIEDAVVPFESLQSLLSGLEDLLKKSSINANVWGQVLSGQIHVMPLLDLASVGDRQKLFRLLDDYTTLVVGLGGKISSQHNDGRVRGAYLQKASTPPVYELYAGIKKLFDPFNILNPGVKINVQPESIKDNLRQEYSLGHHYDHMPSM